MREKDKYALEFEIALNGFVEDLKKYVSENNFSKK